MLIVKQGRHTWPLQLANLYLNVCMHVPSFASRAYHFEGVRVDIGLWRGELIRYLTSCVPCYAQLDSKQTEAEVHAETHILPLRSRSATVYVC